MLKSDTIVLTTSVNNQQNVRIFIYILDDNKIYFTSFEDKPPNFKNQIVAAPINEGQFARIVGVVCKISDT